MEVAVDAAIVAIPAAAAADGGYCCSHCKHVPLCKRNYAQGENGVSGAHGCACVRARI